MKQMLKALVALLIVMCLVLPVFAEGGKETGKVSGRAVPIEIWYGAAVTEAGPPPADWEVIKIIKDKLNIDLKITALPSSPNDQDVKINAAGAANALPDLFMVSRPAWLNLVKNGLVADVSDMFAKMPVRTKAMYDQAAQSHTYYDDGKIKGNFGLASPGSIAKNEGLVIRKDWLDKLGLKVPTTLDEFFAVAKAFTEKDPDGNGKNDTYGFGAYLEINNLEGGLGRRFEPLAGAFGVEGSWNLSKSNFGLNVRKPAYFEFLQFVKKMMDEGVIDPNWMAYKKDDFRGAWKQGRFGMFREQNAALHSESNYAPFDKNFPNGELIVIDAPKGPSGKQSMGPYNVAYRIYAVSKKSAGKKDAIARLLEWMSSEEGYYLLGFGKENVNYVKGPGGVPTDVGLADPSKFYSKSENQHLTQLRNMVFYNSDLELTARYPTYTTAVSKKTMSALKTLRKMQSLTWTACIGGDTIAPPKADLKRFWEQGILEFLTGKRPLVKENWTAWVAELDKMGAAQWEKEALEHCKANSLLK
ncbi:MAG: extracellular solute-binding protein [Treponema sp.]|nr:extracellular solute-binding protein [Treponema sp.]